MALTAEQKMMVRGDFVTWTGGFRAHEVEPEQVDTYIDVAAPHNLDKNDLHDFFLAWIEELDSEDS